MVSTMTAPAVSLKSIARDLAAVTDRLEEVLEERQDRFAELSEKLKESAIGLAHEVVIETIDLALDRLLEALSDIEDLVQKRH